MKIRENKKKENERKQKKTRQNEKKENERKRKKTKENEGKRCNFVCKFYICQRYECMSACL